MVKYTGTLLKAPIQLPQIEAADSKILEKKHAAKTLDPYIPDDRLIEAVNLAIVLKRPLLVMGEPGCGKSALAEAVAHELFKDISIDGKKQDYRQWLFKLFFANSKRLFKIHRNPCRLFRR